MSLEILKEKTRRLNLLLEMFPMMDVSDLIESIAKNAIIEENKLGMRFSIIPDKDFQIQTTPVTQTQWKNIVGSNPSNFKGDYRPVEQVSYKDAKEFISKLNQKNDGYTYRLPTEEEWEYAARAGSTTAYSFGDDESKLQDYAWYSDNSNSQTHEVATKKPNAWGLYDMHGNVWELTGSLYTQPSSLRVIRGGSWYSIAGYCRSGLRGSNLPELRWSFVGLRLARTKNKEKQWKIKKN